MSNSAFPENEGRAARDSIVVPAHITTHMSEPVAHFTEEEEPEPMSFAPGRLRRQNDMPASSRRGAALEHDFEAVSARFRGMNEVRHHTQQRSLHEDARRMIETTGDELRVRALEATSPQDRARFTAFAETIDKLLESPQALEYLRNDQVSREIVSYLKRYKAAQRVWGNVDDLRDVVLKASVTAIHIAPCLGYWRQNPNVPDEVKKLLTSESVFGSVFRIAKERKASWVDRLLARYAAVTTALHQSPGKTGPIPIKTRNAVLWPWCKFNIKNVTYRLYRGDSSLAEAEETIADVKLVLVVLNVMLDDIADALQDADLLEPFLAIPFADGRFGVAPAEAYAALRGRLAGLGWPQFEAYFDLAVDCWVAAMEKLKGVVGNAYDALEADFAHDHDLLLKAMRFSAHLNDAPRAVFELESPILLERYGGSGFGDILAHNANRAVFFTIDLMCLLAFDPSRYKDLARAGAVAVYRENAWIYQDAHQIGNSVATGARESESDDITNELFKIANERLNTIDDWPLPGHLALIPGFPRKDAVLRAFELKKAAKQARRHHPEGSLAQQMAQAEYKALGDDIEQMVEMSGAEHYYFLHWLKRREEAVDVFYKCDEWVDRYSLMSANDLVLVLHLTYKGRI
ncbi:Hypothetical protein A7982_03763 [Minicystis rosea]|nr:Hypothetical protein A7982_03763 [Minicystis rosea]